MNTMIDGFKLLKNIGQHESLFQSIEKEVSEAAFALAKKHLKSKTLDLASLRATRSALTDDALLLIFDDLNEKELRAIVKKIDKYCPALTETDDAILRSNLFNLASSQQDPHPKSATLKRPKKSASDKATPSTKSSAKWPESMEARPSRRR
jgi:hypothetical protein